MFRFMSRMFNLDKEPSKKEEPRTNDCPIKNVKCNNICRTDLHIDINKRKELIAFCLAEKDGFKTDALHYWLEAEKIVDKEMGKK